MPQPVLHTERLVMLPLADEHLDLEVDLDSDPEVLRYLWGRARSRDEVIGSHAERMSLGRKVDGLGYGLAPTIRPRGSEACRKAQKIERLTADFLGLSVRM